MKTSAKKLFFLAILLVASIWILTACGNGDSSTSPSSVAPAETKAADEKGVVSSLISKGKRIREISYNLVITSAGLSSESRVWFKDTKMKTDSIFNGQRAISIFDLEKGEIISYIPGDNMATKEKIEEYQGEDNVTPMDYLLQLNDTNYQITGTETVNKMNCKVITFTLNQGKYKEWLSTEYGIVVKFQQGLNGQMTTSEYKDIKVGAGSVPDGTFNLPQGIQVIDLNNIMNNLQPNK